MNKLLNKILTVVFAVLIVAAIAAIVWLAIVPEKGDSFSEFYILGPNSKASDYPKEIPAGKAAAVLVGIVNREHHLVSYNIVVETDNVTIGHMESIKLEDGQKWEQNVSFVPLRIGDNQKVDFLLYKNEDIMHYLSLNLWVDVK